MDAQQKFLLVTSILRLYSSNYFSVLTDYFDSINALVAVHATMIFDMLVHSYLGFGPLAASLALSTHALIYCWLMRATQGELLIESS